MDTENAIDCAFQIKLNQLYNRLHLTIFFLLLIVTAVSIGKSAIFYFVFNMYQDRIQIYNITSNSTAELVYNFMVMPEMASISNSTVFSAQDYAQMGFGILVSGLLILLVNLIERRYRRMIVELNAHPLIYLFTLEVSGLERIEDTKKFIELIKIQRHTENVILDISYVYDMNQYDKLKKDVADSGRNTMTTITTSTRENFTDEDDYDIDTQRKIKRLFENKQQDLFSKKMYITLNDLSIVRDMVNLYHCGLFYEKLKVDLEKDKETKLLEESEVLLIQEAVDGKGFCKNVRVSLAHDVNDVIWKNLGAKSSRKIFLKILCYLFICSVVFVGMGMLKYFATYRSLRTSLGLEDSCFQIMQFKVNCTWMSLNIPIAILPILGTLLIENLVVSTKRAHYSSYTNLKFFLETFFQFLYQFVAMYYAYRLAAMNVRQELNADQYQRIVRYLAIIFTKKLINVIRKRLNKPLFVITINHSTFSVNIVLAFMYLGFYQNLLSPGGIIVISLLALVNWLVLTWQQRDTKNVRSYISFDNMTVFVLFVVGGYALGGIFAFNTQYDFSYRYFTLNSYNDNYFPYFLTTSISILVIYLPALFLVTRHNSVCLRLLDYLIVGRKYEKRIEQLEEHIKVQNYRNDNPYHQNEKRLRTGQTLV